MQAINRIQNAVINANAAVQAGAVVGSANAHRAYPSYKPCESKPVSKCSISMSMSLRRKEMMRGLPRLSPTCQRPGTPTGGKQTGGWRHDFRHDQMPATVWATFVLSGVTRS